MSLHVNNLVGFGGRSGGSGPSIYQIISDRSLTGSLQLCLDAGFGASYTSGQSWLDLSGNGYDFFRGATGSANTDDPTFNGEADGRSASEYFSFDTGDFFRYDTTVETWMSALHQDNAVFSWICGAYTPTAGLIFPFSTVSSSNFSGVTATLTGGGNGTMTVRHASGSARVLSSTGAVTDNAWNFFGGSLDEASASSGILKVNGTTDTGLTVTYTTPSAAAGNAMQLGATRAVAPTANVRLAFVAIWSVALTSTNLDNLYSDIKTARAYGF